MATAETVQMGAAHPPKEESIKAFNEIEGELKTTLQHLRHSTDKHEPQYFQAVKNLSDKQLTNFSSDDLKEVRVATSAYGLHLFGKVLIPESESSPEKGSNAYFMFRAFIGGDSSSVKLHCIHLEETTKSDGDKDFKGIFYQNDPLEWFDV